MTVNDLTSDEILKLDDEIKKLRERLDARDCLATSIRIRKKDIEILTARLNKYESRLIYDQSSYDKTKQQLEDSQKQLEEDEAKYHELSSKENTEGENLRSLYRKRNFLLTHELLNKIYTVNKDNSIIEYLSEDTLTTPIMSEFCKSDKDFLLLHRSQADPRSMFFVVTNFILDVETYEKMPTMTEFKKDDGKRLLNLWECKNAALRTAEEKGLKRVPFDKPCRLEGQTFRNQTGYGWERKRGNLVRERTLYGETTSFLVIGIIFMDDI